MNKLSHSEKYALELASDKRHPNWLNALPLSRYNFNLKKSKFRDEISVSYGLEPSNIPFTCACGQFFYLIHAFHRAKDGYTHMRHDEIRYNFANLMSDVCIDVEIEQKHQSIARRELCNNLSTTDEDARLDDKINALWGSRFSRTFLCVKVFNPHAKTSRRLLEKGL